MQNPFDSEERRAFRETVRRFLASEIEPHVDAWDEAGAYPHEVNEKLCGLGVFGFGIPAEYGGLGFDDFFMRKDAAVEMGRVGAGGIFASAGSRIIMLKPLVELASDEIKARALPELLSGCKGGALAITEPGGGSDVANMKTTARREGDHWVLNGTKTFITGGMQASYFVVGARTGDDGLAGISLFFIEADTTGFSRTPIERKMGWWASDTATLYFDNARVPAANLMGPENHGFFAIMQNFNYERFTMSCQMLGMAQRCFDECVSYAQERHTFGRPLLKHQVIRHKISDMSMQIDAMDAYLTQIAWAANEGGISVPEICKAKVFCSTSLEKIASEAMQVFGGAGYLRGNPIERIYREVKVMAIGGGSEEIMRELATRQMGL